MKIIGTLLFGGALIWKLYQLSRAPYDRALRAVTACIACFFAGQTLSWAPVLDRSLFPGASELASMSFIVIGAYFLMCFYLFSAAPARRAPRRVAWEAVPLLVTVTVLVAATLSIPDDIRTRVLKSSHAAYGPVAVFYLTASVYLLYIFASAVYWAARYARISDRRLARGLWLVAIGLSVTVTVCAARAVMIAIRWAGGTVPPALFGGISSLFALAGVLFLIGVSYPGVATRLAALRVWLHHRRAYRRLGPLWTTLHEAYPQAALHRAPGRWTDLLSLRNVHRKYYRRVIECRDGLVQISPYLPEAPDDRELSPDAQAERLREALRAHAAGRPASSRAVALALPPSDDLESDARQLLALSDALADVQRAGSNA